MKINDREIKAVIFDLDGTLIDSTFLWVKIDEEFFERHGMKTPENYAKEIDHIGLQEAAILTKNKYGIKESCEEIVDQWNKAAYEQYAYKVELKPYVKEYLDYLKRNGVLIALATANSENLYGPCLRRLGIDKYFDFIADVDKVKASKSTPTLFNFVAKNLNVSNHEAAVFEDNTVALKTAYENDYLSVAVYDKFNECDDDLKKKYSYIFINSYKELL